MTDPHNLHRARRPKLPSRSPPTTLKDPSITLLVFAVCSSPSPSFQSRRPPTFARTSSRNSSLSHITRSSPTPMLDCGLNCSFMLRRHPTLSSRLVQACCSTSSGLTHRPTLRCVFDCYLLICEMFSQLLNVLQSALFAQAAYRAATTLALVAPATIVPLLFAQFEDDLSLSHIANLGVLEYGVWATPEGTPFVDGALSIASLSLLPSPDS